MRFREDGLYPHEIRILPDAWVSWFCTAVHLATVVWFCRRAWAVVKIIL